MNVQPVQSVSVSRECELVRGSRLTQNVLMRLIGSPGSEEVAYQKLCELVTKGDVEASVSEGITCFKLKFPRDATTSALLFNGNHHLVGF